jgi:hypothetical protein
MFKVGDVVIANNGEISTVVKTDRNWPFHIEVCNGNTYTQKGRHSLANPRPEKDIRPLTILEKALKEL